MAILEGANSRQEEAINTSEGPLLVTAGPGTGKTYTLVQRTLYLIEKCGVLPENILIATFTDKAARELVTRISDELYKRDITANINDMYVGTFHSICLRLLKEYLDYTRLRKNYRIMDAFDQQYTVFKNFNVFQEINGLNLLFDLQRIGKWTASKIICKYVDKLSEELISPDSLIADKDPSVIALGQVFQIYDQLLEDKNLLDFSSIMAETYNLLVRNPAILDKVREKITHIMVDEYQDTNHIQEQIVLLIAGDKENICVVGDDDQGLYRFRGATIRNILEFPQKFAPGKCKIISLVTNYRSESSIIDFYNKWISTTKGAYFKFDWDKFRYKKTIEPAEPSALSSPAVVKLSGVCERDWHDKIFRFIQSLKDSGKLTDYNQIAFLFKSVKHKNAVNLAKFLEDNGVRVYAPRSDMFFKRDEIRITIGCLMLMFPDYVDKLENDKFSPDNKQIYCYEYYKKCLELAVKILGTPENASLRHFIADKGQSHYSLTGTTDYAYSGLIYQLFGFKLFADFLDTGTDSGVVDLRPARNLARLTQIIGKFEFLHEVDTLNAKFININTELLFNMYLRLLFDGGINEYEDDSEYAPSGCVSFMTIHQAKGMEFPIVFVDSLYGIPRTQNDALMSKIESNYSDRQEFEPLSQIKYFDFWRLYYTAFSRAQNLLILTCSKDSRNPSNYFRDIYNSLPSVEAKNFHISEFEFKTVRDVNIKKTYSFTSHITVYETCGLQYKFYKELEFMPVRASAMLFGMLVHETIEDIHRAALRNEAHNITNENISAWLKANYESLSRSTHSYLSKKQIDTALNHVTGYAERQNGDWSRIRQAEFDVSLVKPDYIIQGKIDLVRGVDDSIEIIDFKSTRKPDIYDPKAQKLIELYRRQLHIYAHLVEQRTGQKVSQMNLYFTGETDSVPVISFKYSQTAIQGTLAAFDDTVHKIMSKDFHKKSSDDKICKNCDFRYYCKN